MTGGTQPTLPDATLAEAVARLPWYHAMDLPGGVRTPGHVDCRRNLEILKLPTSLAGRRVLDIGAWDGFYSFEVARRGAASVLATDWFVWRGETWGDKAAFELARRSLGFEGVVEDRLIDVMSLSPEAVGTFDVVLFLGVLYHMKDPIGALERVSGVCRDLLVLETELALDWVPWPAARVFPGSELNGDPTNWFSFNAAALVGLLGVMGFSRVDVVWRTSPARRAARSLRYGTVRRRQRARGSSARVVVHARKG